MVEKMLVSGMAGLSSMMLRSRVVATGKVRDTSIPPFADADQLAASCGRWRVVMTTVGLGISEFVYRIIALFVSVVSGMDSVHGLSARGWPWQEKKETMHEDECIYTSSCTAIALQSIHLFQSLLQNHCHFSPAHLPLPVYRYSTFHSRSYRRDMGVFLALCQWA